MPKKISMAEIAHQFRGELASDFTRAGVLLGSHPQLIDYPVYGDSESALHFFATENRADVVRWLLSRGASPNGIAEDDFPLHAAAQLGHREVCELLVNAGAGLDLRDSGGETALHKASSGGHCEIIRMLLVSGADPSITEMCGEKPIDQALPRKWDQVRAEFESHTQNVSGNTESLPDK